jgi:uncharacterized membrane protein YfcA
MDETSILVAAIIAAAFFGESIFGFGGGLISIPLLSLLIGVKHAVTLVLLAQLLMGLLIWKSYKHIDWKSAKPMTASIIIGTVAGTFLLSQVSTQFLQIFLAITILIYLAKMLWFNGFTLGGKADTTAATAAGLGGGLFQGLIGTGGPVLTMYLSVAVHEKLSMRATLIYLFFVTSVVRMAISIPSHLFTPEILQLAVISLPLFLIAIWFGQRMHHKVSDKYYKYGVNAVLGGSAILLLGKSIL